MDMNEASVLMPRLFDFGMYYGHLLLVQQYNLAHVSKMAKNSETVATPNKNFMWQKLKICRHHHISEFHFFYLDDKWHIFSLSLDRLNCPCLVPTK